MENHHSSMEELIHLLQLQKHHKRKRRKLLDKIDGLHVASEVQKRLLRIQPLVQKSLSDCIRTANKVEFRAGFDAFGQIHNIARALSDDPSGSADARSGAGNLQTSSNEPAFLEIIPKDTCDLLLDFLSDVVSDSAFLVQSLAGLDQFELEQLCDGRYHASGAQSVLGISTPSSVRRISSPGLSSTGQHTEEAYRAREQVYDLARHEGLSLLVELVGLHPASNAQAVRRRQDHIWANVCAHLLTEIRPGREKFVLAVLDKFGHEVEPCGKRALETWILQTLHGGRFLVPQSGSMPFQRRSHTQNAGQDSISATRAEDFFRSAINALFDLIIKNGSTRVVPQRVLNICTGFSGSHELSETDSQKRSFFFLGHWLFSSYLLDNIITPESRGLLLDHYFPETARHRVLREIVLRAQRIVLDVVYSWTHTASTDTNLRAKVEHMANIFKPPKTPVIVEAWPHASNEYFLRSVSPTDICTLVNGLVPARKSRSGAAQLRTQAHQTAEARQVHVSKAPDSSEVLVRGIKQFPAVDPEERLREHHRPSAPVISTAVMEKRAAALKKGCTEMMARVRQSSSADPSTALIGRWALLQIRHGSIRHIARTATVTAKGTTVDRAEVHDQHNDLFQLTVEGGSAYHDIRLAVLRLLSNGPLSEGVERLSQIRSDELQLRPSTVARKPNPFTSGGLSPDTSTNPFRKRVVSTGDSSPIPTSPGHTKHYGSTLARPISALFEAALQSSQGMENFSKAQTYAEALRKVNGLVKSDDNVEDTLLHHFINDMERTVVKSKTAVTRLEDLLALLEHQYFGTEVAVKSGVAMANKTRAKMWYCTDVRTAAPYASLEKLGQAIRDMVTPSAVASKRTDPPPLRHKGTLRPKNLNAVRLGDASLLDIMVADPVYRLENKLKDDQVVVTQTWLERSNIENICPGEERLHRLLCELSKCLNQLISADPAQSPVLWGSELFQRDRHVGETEAIHSELAGNESREAFSSISRPSSSGSEPFHDHRTKGFLGLNIATASMSSTEASSDLDGRSPTVLTRSSTTPWSPTGYRSQSPFSNVSPPSRAWSPAHLRTSMSRETFQSTNKVRELLGDLRQSILGLLVGDIISSSFHDGSETDARFFRGTGHAFALQLSAHATKKTDDADLRSSQRDRSQRGGRSRLNPTEPSGSRDQSDQSERGNNSPAGALSFDINFAKQRLIQRFDLCSGPYAKLQVLNELYNLLLATSDDGPAEESNLVDDDSSEIDVQVNARITPATSATPQDTMGTAGSTTNQPDNHFSLAVKNFQALFREHATRPANLFLDIQTMASLLPADVLDSSTAQGRTFWTAAAAAVSLKDEMSQAMVTAAAAIIAEHAHPHAPSSASGAAILHPPLLPPSASPEPDPLSRAAELLRLAAAQSHPAAQRELATMYLTHADLLPRVLAPFARTADVFRSSSSSSSSGGGGGGGGSGGGGGGSGASQTQPAGTATAAAAPVAVVGEKQASASAAPPARTIDTETLCIAAHWMGLAAKGGDRLAVEFMKGKD